MRTDDLIDALARETVPMEPIKRAPRVAIALGIGLAVGAALLILTLGARKDIATSFAPVLMKAGFSAAAAAVALPLLLQLARPGRVLGWRIAAIGGFAALGVLVVAVALAGADPGERMRAWTGGAFPWCLVLIPCLAAPTAIGLSWVIKDMAPTRLEALGAAIGAVSGGIGAMVYSMWCPMDSTAFVVTWYSVAIALCAAVGSLVVGRLLRW